MYIRIKRNDLKIIKMIVKKCKYKKSKYKK